jgi:SAM-dependent methyltransferase
LQDSNNEELYKLKKRADNLRLLLESIDNKLFDRLRTNLLAGSYRDGSFKELLKNHFDMAVICSGSDLLGYDHLDTFIDRLLPLELLSEPNAKLENEMIHYQKTPARIVFEIVEKGCFKASDVFVDIGSGLGQVAILINLLSCIKVTGIEIDPALCIAANDCVSALGLNNVTFINNDARYVNYAEGTLFFMFTPFKGAMLNVVLSLLYQQSLSRQIRLITYGPCTMIVALENWLKVKTGTVININQPVFFQSL